MSNNHRQLNVSNIFYIKLEWPVTSFYNQNYLVFLMWIKWLMKKKSKCKGKCINDAFTVNKSMIIYKYFNS